MRYTTSRFGETARLLGEFAEGRPATVASGIYMKLFLLQTGAEVLLTTSGCTEISGSRAGGFASYAWPTSFISSQPSIETEYLYMMQDAITSRVQKGKFVLGGFPDESAIQRYGGGVSVDTASGVAGTAFPLGTPESPVSNLADALSIRSTFGLPRVLRVRGAMTLSGDLSRFSFEGVDPLNDRVTSASGCVLNGAAFTRVTVAGDFSATPSGVVGSEITLGVTGQTISGLRGLFLTALVRGTIRPATSLIGLDVSTDETFSAVIEMAGAPSPTRVAIGAVIGSWTVQGGTGAGHQVGIGGAGARITLASSTTGGVYIFSGVGELFDDSTSNNGVTDVMVHGTLLDISVSTRAAPGDHMNVVLSGVSGIADHVWDEVLAGHLTAGTTGFALSLASGQAPTVGAIADAVWDEPMVDHLTAGTTGIELASKAEPGEAMALTSGTISGVADQVWREPISDHSGVVGSTAERLSQTAQPGDQMDLLDQAVDRVWDEDIADHQTPGTTGEALLLAASGAVSGIAPPTVGAIADAVWDEAIAGHSGAGSAGLRLQDTALDGASMGLTDQAVDDIWDEDNGEHPGVDTTGGNLHLARAHITNRRVIDTTTDPWQEVIYGDDGTTEIQRADLFDNLGDPINAGNNPGGIMIAERRPV